MKMTKEQLKVLTCMMVARVEMLSELSRRLSTDPDALLDSNETALINETIAYMLSGFCSARRMDSNEMLFLIQMMV